MEERTNDIRVRCRLSILRLYPAHRQAQLTDTTDFDAWKSENVAHMQKLLADPSADIDTGWPDPAAWERKTAAASMLDELEAVKEKLDEREVHEEPPAEIADLYEAHGMSPDALLAKHAELTSWIADAGASLPPATDAQKAMHRRLTPHVPWLKSRAKSVEVVG